MNPLYFLSFGFFSLAVAMTIRLITPVFQAWGTADFQYQLIAALLFASLPIFAFIAGAYILIWTSKKGTQ